MDKKEIVARLRKIISMIEGDTFTADNLETLIKEIESK